MALMANDIEINIGNIDVTYTIGDKKITLVFVFSHARNCYVHAINTDIELWLKQTWQSNEYARYEIYLKKKDKDRILLVKSTEGNKPEILVKHNLNLVLYELGDMLTTVYEVTSALSNNHDTDVELVAESNNRYIQQDSVDIPF